MFLFVVDPKFVLVLLIMPVRVVSRVFKLIIDEELTKFNIRLHIHKNWSITWHFLICIIFEFCFNVKTCYRCLYLPLIICFESYFVDAGGCLALVLNLSMLWKAFCLAYFLFNGIVNQNLRWAFLTLTQHYLMYFALSDTFKK